MVIVPSTNIILLKTPIELGDDNQLTWSTKQEQYNYFNSLPKLLLDDSTYQRKENIIRFPTNSTTTYEDLLQYNYCMYQNEAYDDKWFYAYITEINYVNDGMSTIKLETDVWNTWCFDLEIKQSFVEREHVNDDTIGLHTLPENVELGEFIINGSDLIDFNSDTYSICMGLSKVPNGTPQMEQLTRTYNGIYSGLYYFIFRSDTSCSKMIEAYDKAGLSSNIVTIFMIPAVIGNDATWYTATIENIPDIEFGVLPSSNSSRSLVNNSTITMNSSLDSYTPKNNKLYTWPYNYLYVTNNAGNDTLYKYEDFTNHTPVFSVNCAVTTGCSIRLFPKNYKRKDTSQWETACYNYGMTGFKYPVCSWQSDSYTNWLTQQSVNLPIDVFKSTVVSLAGIGMIASGLGVGAGVGLVGSGMIGLSNSIKQVYEASFLPVQAKGNINSSDVALSDRETAFVYFKMSVRQEYAKIIDDFFQAYGYKVNALKIPNIRGRRNWNYVKTIGCNITGNIPQIDLEKIRNQFDKGVTFWHHSNTFLDYSQTNDII